MAAPPDERPPDDIACDVRRRPALPGVALCFGHDRWPLRRGFSPVRCGGCFDFDAASSLDVGVLRVVRAASLPFRSAASRFTLLLLASLLAGCSSSSSRAFRSAASCWRSGVSRRRCASASRACHAARRFASSSSALSRIVRSGLATPRWVIRALSPRA